MAQVYDETQLILATGSERLALGGANGFVPMGERQAARLFQSAGLWFGPRGTLEETERFRQVIPYVVLQIGDRVVRYRRTASGREARLHGRASIGLGGHVDLADVATQDGRIDLLGTLSRAAEREVQEELGQVDCEHRRWIGVLVDDATAVSRIHVGFVAIWRLRAMPDGSPEDAIGTVSTASVEALVAVRDELETWSTMLLPHLPDVLADRASDFATTVETTA